ASAALPDSSPMLIARRQLRWVKNRAPCIYQPDHDLRIRRVDNASLIHQAGDRPASIGREK
ncbi:MAG: hypothetical protein CVV19_12815, partial [Gammaproteobacteria bacterium HGW-Gammaproteobacteria-9]